MCTRSATLPAKHLVASTMACLLQIVKCPVMAALAELILPTFCALSHVLWRMGRRYQDMPITDILQMMGRAGRPQYDRTGVAVIMVHDPKKSFYK